MRKVVGVADLIVTNNLEDVLITYSLGSCIAVIIYDPIAKVGGMLHYMLPESSINREKAKLNPAMFADTGVPLLFKGAYKLGAMKKNIRVKIAGGAKPLGDNGAFNIGKRNYTALRKIFWRNNVMIQAEHIGGIVNRTVWLEMKTGRVFLKVSGLGELEL